LTLMQETMVLTGVVFFLCAVVIGQSAWRVIFFIAAGFFGASGAVSIWRANSSNKHEGLEREFPPEEATVRRMNETAVHDVPISENEEGNRIMEKPERQGIMTEESKNNNMPEPSSPKSKTFDWDLKEFIEAVESEQRSSGGPRTEFNTLIKRVLTVIKDVNFAHTVALFWINREKQQLVLENFVSDSTLFMSRRRFDFGSDFISQVAQSGKPQIVNYLNALSRQEMLPYYDGKESVQTFLGVPIFYPVSTQEFPLPVAVLAVDCRESDAYGNETIALMAQFAKMISTLLASYTSKYDLLLDSELLRSIGRFRESLEREFNLPVIARALAEETARLVPWDYVSLVLFDEKRKIWTVQHVLNRMNDPYVPLLSEIDMQQSFAGSVIQTGIPKIVDSFEALHQPRFYQAERCESSGSLIGLPLSSLTRCYGALIVESKDLRTYSEADVQIVQKIVESASWALEILNLTEMTNNFVSLDETTSVGTRKAFLARMQEEVQRANDFTTELSLVMLSIDRVDAHIERQGKEAFDCVLQNVGRIIQTSIRPYDFVGRFDFNCFMVILINTTSNEASLWAEKIRKNVASNIINVDDKSFSVTCSIGVVGMGPEGDDVELLENANRVLSRAVEAGGNVVRVY
jgi:diguanylate cyclase (GGDEF)-like protein